jgi:preprotein translocase subunit SecD
MQNIRALFAGIIVIVSTIIIVKLPISYGLDLKGGMQLILEAKETKQKKLDQDAVIGVMEVIRNRIDSLGLTEPVIRRKGNEQIIIELPGINDIERATKLIGETAKLEFAEAEWTVPGINSLPDEERETLIGKNSRIEILTQRDKKGNILRETPLIIGETVLDGSDLKNSMPGTTEFGEPIVFIEFNKEGTKKFYNATKSNTGKPLAILLDGKVISAPNIQEPISGGKAQISGSFSVEEMRDLVIKLKAGALPVPVDIISNKIIGPTLGKDSINKSIRAAIIGFILITLYLVTFYRLSGIIASISLITYLITVVASLKILGATLTLPGIAGLILTMGMAVDANIIIFERIKEDLSNELNIWEAILGGFNQAFRTILDANFTTLIAAFVLFWLGTGTIKGFAITLSVGILVSMFSALFITKILLLISTKLIKKNTSLILKGNR